MTNLISRLSKLITEDPDIYHMLSEMDADLGMDKPLTANDIDKQTQQMSPNKDTDKQVKDQIKKQEETQKKADQARKKAIEPQFKELQKNIKNVSTGIAKSTQNLQTGTDSITDLDSDLASINSLVTNLQRTM